MVKYLLLLSCKNDIMLLSHVPQYMNRWFIAFQASFILLGRRFIIVRWTWSSSEPLTSCFVMAQNHACSNSIANNRVCHSEQLHRCGLSFTFKSWVESLLCIGIVYAQHRLLQWFLSTTVHGLSPHGLLSLVYRNKVPTCTLISVVLPLSVFHTEITPVSSSLCFFTT